MKTVDEMIEEMREYLAECDIFDRYNFLDRLNDLTVPDSGKDTKEQIQEWIRARKPEITCPIRFSHFIVDGDELFVYSSKTFKITKEEWYMSPEEYKQYRCDKISKERLEREEAKKKRRYEKYKQLKEEFENEDGGNGECNNVRN